MLVELELRSLAIVDEDRVHFAPGLNAVTGESGTGKSMWLGALALLAGDRARAGWVRSGAAHAEVIGRFEGDLARGARRDLGLPPGDELVLHRRIGRNAKAWAGGKVVTVAALRGVGERLFERAGQRAWTRLLTPEGQLEVVDQAAGSARALVAMGAAFGAVLEGRRALSALRVRVDEAARQQDWLRFQVQELDRLALSPEEAREAVIERDRLLHAAELARGAHSLIALLEESDGSALEQLGRAADQLDGLGGWDASLRPLAEELRGAVAAVEEVVRSLGPHRDALEDPERLAQLDDQLAALRSLERRHGREGDALIALGQELRARLELVDRGEHAEAELVERLAGAEASAERAAGALRERRQAALGPLRDQVEGRLRRLAMPDARVGVELLAKALGADGHDEARFLLAANPGEASGALAEVASGGELGRVALALSLALGSSKATWVLDEVDAGLGGHAAAALGDELCALARSGQVIVITHQPRLAALADHHVRITKEVVDGRTRSRAQVLGTHDRVQELHRMLGGDRASLAFARGLLLETRRATGRKGATAA